MKFTKRHLVGSVALLVASILYNVWVFWGGAAAPAGQVRGISAEAPAGASVTGPAGVAPIDPMEIPPPPAVDVAIEPAWERDPFRRVGADVPKPNDQAAQPVATDLRVRSILFSPERRVAIVDSRVVGVGDRLPTGATVVDIARDAVTLRMPSGEHRRLALRTPPPGAPK